MNYFIAPSILSANFAALGQDVEAVIEAGADLIHIDVMDNHYVPNLTIGPAVCKSLRDHGIQVPFDVHLMIKPVDAMIPLFAKAGANYITVHPEATEHLDRTLQLIRDQGCKAGLSFNPATPLDILEYVIERLDLILIMSVNPGFGGQSFIPQMLPKIRKAREWIASSGQSIRLEVDGGITPDNIEDVATAGADMFVAGSAIFNSGDYKATIALMREKLAQSTPPIPHHV